MTKVECTAVAGDSYNLRSVLLADGTGAVVGAALGSPFPPAVYIGHPSWKVEGSRYRNDERDVLSHAIGCSRAFNHRQ